MKRFACIFASLVLAMGIVPATAQATTMQPASIEQSSVATQSTKATSLAKASVSLEYTSCTYDGNRHYPEPTVTLKGKTLTKGTDYSVDYANCIYAGQATVTITGKGNYRGSASKSFTITPANISGRTIMLGYYDCTYNGHEKEPSVNVAGIGYDWANRNAYSVTFNNNVNAGTASVTVTGRGNYTGSATEYFTIEKASNPIGGMTWNFITIDGKRLAKKKKSIDRYKASSIYNAEGKVTFKKKSGSKKIKVSKNGKVTIAKKTGRGTYRVEVRAKAAGNSNYKAGYYNYILSVSVR